MRELVFGLDKGRKAHTIVNQITLRLTKAVILRNLLTMPRPKPTEEDKEKRIIRAKEWIDFRFNNLFTQRKLAETLGVSRRTVQMVEAGLVTPHPRTIRLFEALVSRYTGKVA